jgi:hypothetical protein
MHIFLRKLPRPNLVVPKKGFGASEVLAEGGVSRKTSKVVNLIY